jgi:anaerobic magnesium-protoporphyrin IX monomethyl ester cyclase
MRSIARKEGYAYSETAPYQVLRTPWLSFEEIRRIEAISRLLETFYNSGRFAASLRVLAQEEALSRQFERLSRHLEERGTGGNLSLTGWFEALRGFGAASLGEGALARLDDALCFDYCLTGYPGGNAPSFCKPNQEKGEAHRLPKGKPGERLRYYRRRFARDFRDRSGAEAVTEITFVYRSAPGEGLRVEVLDAEEIAFLSRKACAESPAP